MQYNRVNISVHIIDLYNYNQEINLNTFGFIHNKNSMRYLSQFTYGEYYSESHLSYILDLPEVNKFTTNIIDFTNRNGQSIIKNKTYNNDSLSFPFSVNKCKKCVNSISIFFCIKPINTITKNESLLLNNDEINSIRIKNHRENGFNLMSLDSNFYLFTILTSDIKMFNELRIFQKETVLLNINVSLA